MKAKELRELSTEELHAKEAELRGELLSARVKKATGQLENTSQLSRLRRDIARVLTLLGAEKAGDKE